MNVKIDTKEKFTVITPELPQLSANMTEEIKDLLLSYLKKEIPHIVLNLELVNEMDDTIAKEIIHIQQEFYVRNASFVICQVQEGVKKLLKEMELLDIMNITPTESEAWDMVQMEEMEREMLREGG